MEQEILNRLRDAVRRTEELTRDRGVVGRGHDDADDSVGTIGTDDACGFDPFPLLRALHRAGARAVVIGQVAGILHGSTELTGDLDLLWDGDPGQADALVAAFGAVGGSLIDDDGAALPLGVEAFRRDKVQFASPGASGDCCTPALPWGSLAVADFLGRALTVTDSDGSEIHYLRRADLISMRRAVGRPKDLRRADELEGL
ncbi:hypothetical protein [Streptacidiphilus carbonis]|jgi:hypothetical protein|uniref:hypothetical protein n=1 Tax=Streptacidiphilus carbonis TaxID=105422 RepID=UPI0005A94A85|nr:hypothetical protein [Streptacidiphilus carbonis]